MANAERRNVSFPIEADHEWLNGDELEAELGKALGIDHRPRRIPNPAMEGVTMTFLPVSISVASDHDEAGNETGQRILFTGPREMTRDIAERVLKAHRKERKR